MVDHPYEMWERLIERNIAAHLADEMLAASSTCPDTAHRFCRLSVAAKTKP
jgi:hypothetical protein